MTFGAFIRIISFLLALVSAALLVPAGFAFGMGERALLPVFLLPFAACWIFAFVTNFCTRNIKLKISIHGGYVLVAACWIFASLLGTLPFMLSGAIPRFADALFESVSGFSTTGATILSEIELLPKSLLLWRCETHWLGGMGIIALTVALFPLLGVGGFQLLKAETSGTEKSKITPHIATTAKILWIIYVSFTVLQTVLLMCAGLSFFDALSHAFSTIGSGGFSTRTLSIGYYQSRAVERICTLFMILAGINFSLYFYAVSGRIKEIRQNTELKAYFSIIAASTFVLALIMLPKSASLGAALERALFQTAAIITTTGFTSGDYGTWVPAAQVLLLALMCIGGCSGSTAGGIKVIRWVALFKRMNNNMQKILHPHGVFNIQLNGGAARRDLTYTVVSFMFLFLLFASLTAFIAALDGADTLTSLSAGVALIGNVGPGLGKIGPAGNYAFFSVPAKLWFCFVMLAGRLEIYAMAFLCLPSFWKRNG